MAFISEKIQRMTKAVYDNLALRGLTVAQTNLGLITVSSGGNVHAILRFGLWDATTPDKLDGIGLTQRVYSPHKVEVLLDGDDTLADPTIVGTIMYEVSRLGIRLDLYSVAGTPLIESEIKAANFIKTLDSIEYPLTGSI